jgi:hypothetical protein
VCHRTRRRFRSRIRFVLFPFGFISFPRRSPSPLCIIYLLGTCAVGYAFYSGARGQGWGSFRVWYVALLHMRVRLRHPGSSSLCPSASILLGAGACCSHTAQTRSRCYLRHGHRPRYPCVLFLYFYVFLFRYYPSIFMSIRMSCSPLLCSQSDLHWASQVNPHPAPADKPTNIG